jgi:predicted aspartyl protease
MLANIFSISSTIVKDAAIEEGSIDRNHLVITYTLLLNNKEIPTHALIDCGATGYAFIDQDFTDHYQLSPCP